MGPRREFIALDLETTGLTAQTDRIVEIGAIRFLETGEELGRYQTLVNPRCPMPASAYAIHGLSDWELAHAPWIGEVLSSFLGFLGEPGSAVLMAHHASFDAGFLGCELARSGMSAPGLFLVDTLALARRKLPDLRSHRLDALATFLGLGADAAHRALADSACVKDLWLRLGGAAEPDQALVSYPISERRESSAVPRGWDLLRHAAARGLAVQIEYEGGSRGTVPRTISPLRFVNRGGSTYVVAICHLDSLEKSFRLDRIRRFDLIPAGVREVVPVDSPPANG